MTVLLRERIAIMRHFKLLVAVGLMMLATVGYADDFGIAPQKSNLTPSGAAQSVNQLLGQSNETSVLPGQQRPGSLNMAQVDQILAKSKQQAQAQAQQQVQQQTQQALQSQPVAQQTQEDSTFGDTAMSREAFVNVLRGVLPLTPDQIRTLRKRLAASQRAAVASPSTPPKPTSSAVIVNLAPGATPPVVRLSNGFVSSLVFLDSTGQPWPIQSYDIGDPKSFNIQWNKKGNTLLVQANTNYKPGNLAVMLKGQDTPVMVTLIPGQQAVDYRVDLRVPGFGPNAQPMMSSMPAAESSSLLDFLNGVPPQGAKSLQVAGGPCEAWKYNGNVYLRTSLTALSPGWISAMSSPDGTHVYEIAQTPVVLASFQGKIVQLTIQGL